MDAEPTKTCSACGDTKALTEFHRERRVSSGRRSRCRVCESVQRQSWYYERGGKGIVRKNTASFRERTGYPGWSDPMAVAARRKAQAAIRRGKLLRQPCETCGSSHELNAHHDDYTKPLAIRWLCGPCHRTWHKVNEPIRDRGRKT